MKEMSLGQITKACNGTYYGPEELKQKEVMGVVIDSRKVEKDFLFAAVKGERVDGHSFIPGVFAKGALCCLSEQVLENPAGPYILVESTLQAIKDLAEYYRQTLDIPVIGITGSVGKTSTKEMIAAVLSTKYHVLKTEGNFNNEIGVPLTIFQIRPEHEAAVLEMGINHFGEMTRLSKMVRPTVCMFTNIGLCHLENLKSRDGILQAKTEMLSYAREGARIYINGDDDKLHTLKKTLTPAPTCFGLSPENDIYADEIENLGLDGVRCTIHAGIHAISVTIPIPGMHMVHNALAGAAVGIGLSLSMEEIKAGIESLQPVSGRNHRIHTGRWTILDDCYNANPVSMAASLDVLSYALGRRVAILGDMGELGENEKLLHYNVGCHAVEAGIDVIVAIGALAAQYVDGAKAKNPNQITYYYPEKETFLKHLSGILQDGDSILVKASHFMEFPEIVSALERLGNR